MWGWFNQLQSIYRHQREVKFLMKLVIIPTKSFNHWHFETRIFTLWLGGWPVVFRRRFSENQSHILIRLKRGIMMIYKESVSKQASGKYLLTGAAMPENWEKQLSCAEQCERCNKTMEKRDRRILSVFDHQPICTECKKEEEKRSDYEDVSRQMIAECMQKTSKPYGDPASYCFHHFCPFKC